MKLLIVCMLLWVAFCQDFVDNPRRSTSAIEFEDGHELLRYMHIKQHKMEDHYIKQVGTIYIFYNISPKDQASARHIEEWREDVFKSIKDMSRYIDIEEILVDDESFDGLLNFYDWNGQQLKDKPLVLIDEFDERVWVYRLDQSSKIKDRLKSAVAEGVTYFSR